MSVNPGLTCLWTSTGAYISGERPHSKAALRRALQTVPGEVRFDVTAPQGSRHAGETIPATAEAIGQGKLNVTGPDPAGNPLWYAIVQVSSDGHVVVA